MVVFDGHDKAILGYSVVWDTSGNRVARVVYDAVKILGILQSDGMTEEEAVEWMDFNMEGAYVGPSTPIVLWPADRESIDEMVDLHTDQPADAGGRDE